MEADPFYDVIVIGSGAAGLNLVLQLDPSARVLVLSKGPLQEGSSYYAQGGIAAVLDEKDTVESHIQDTLIAGGDLCDPKVVRFIVEHGAEAIRRLDKLGVGFTRYKGIEYHLAQEGGHSYRRIAHAADATGRAVESTLVDRAREMPNLDIREHHLALDLIRETRPNGTLGRCVGVYAYDREDEHVRFFRGKTIVLATGGASKVYLYTTNPDSSTGDGIAMAWRAGCRVANMEFTQFHPTCLYHPEAKSFLLTEALRGEGAKLRLPNGETFMQKYDPRAELAPRDIVARAIDHEMKRLGIDNVFLDITHQPAEFVIEHFPTVYQHCLEYGFDLTKQPIPVVPAAHYTCGGVMTDLHGRTDIENLYAVGEATFTGLHGANRMASNSLLECLVMSTAAATDINARLAGIAAPPELVPWDESWVREPDEEVVVSHNWEELRRFMWDYVGIVRSNKRLQRAKRRVDLLTAEINEYYSNFRVTNDLLELRNLTLVADLIIQSAIARKESRGIHYTIDYPELDAIHRPSDTVLVPERFSGAVAA